MTMRWYLEIYDDEEGLKLNLPFKFKWERKMFSRHIIENFARLSGTKYWQYCRDDEHELNCSLDGYPGPTLFKNTKLRWKDYAKGEEPKEPLVLVRTLKSIVWSGKPLSPSELGLS